MINGKESGELYSWKEISAYLGVSVRTAQKWEKQAGLPIRRLNGEKARVFAYADELRRWRATETQIAGPAGRSRILTVYAIVSTLLLAALAGVFFRHRFSENSKGRPAQYRVEAQRLIISDTQGEELWRARLAEPVEEAAYAPETGKVVFDDLDGDGTTEVLFVYCPADPARKGVKLVCYSQEGGQRWTFVPGKKVTSSVEEFVPPFLIGKVDVASTGKPGPKKVVLNSYHVSFYPNQLAVLDHTGRLEEEYWHSGHLSKMRIADLDGDGADEILLAGVSNSYRAATLVALTLGQVSGASLEKERPDYQLRGFSEAAERARILFPRTCINQRLQQYNGVSTLLLRGDVVELGVEEREGPGRVYGIMYYFTPGFRLTKWVFNDRLTWLHRQMEMEQHLDHELTREEMDRMGEITVLR